MTQKQPKVEREFGFLKIKNKHFQLMVNRNTDGLQHFVEVKDYDKRLSLAKKLTEKLKNSLDKEKIMMEVLMKESMKTLQGIKKELGVKKAKPKTRRHHCVDMQVGRYILPIVE
jgi:hypothetical protein